jgi:long-chain acyl-CoA synthetase
MSQRIWQKSYPEGIPFDVDVTQFDSIVEIFEESFRKYPESPAFHNFGKTLKYKDLDDMSARVAVYLQKELGLARGSRVAIMLPNVLQFPTILFGVLRAGMIVTNINPLYTARELEHQLADSGASAVFIFANAAHLLESVIDNTQVKHVVYTEVGDFLDFPKKQLINFVLKKVKKMVPPWKIKGARRLNDVLAGQDPTKYQRLEFDRTETALLQYTGGTTGVAKGAELTHHNIVSNVVQAKAWIEKYFGGKKRRIVTPLPLYHIFSLTANCFTFTALGGDNILITNPRDIGGFIKEMKKWDFTALTGVNTLFKALMSHPKFSEIDFSNNIATLAGGMAVQQTVAEQWAKATGQALVEAYGLTETSPAVCMNPIDLKEYNGAIGLPIPSTDVDVRDDSGKVVEVGEVGELCIKGPQVFKGYWQKEEETNKVFTEDGYFKTGDMAKMDPEGFFRIVDRKKDMILVSGFNVYPNEIEDVVCHHQKVFEAAAIGVPDEKSTEVVKLFVLKSDPSLTAEELKAYCKKNLAAYKVPKIYEFVDSFPKSNVGKILRRELR